MSRFVNASYDNPILLEILVESHGPMSIDLSKYFMNISMISDLASYTGLIHKSKFFYSNLQKYSNISKINYKI